MPDVRNQTTVQAIARAYMDCGRNKAKALVKVGYSRTYAYNGNCAKLFAKPVVMEAIRKLEVELAEKHGCTVAQLEVEYDEVRRLALSINQPAAAATAITGKARLYGMDKDAAVKTDQDIELDKAQAEQARKVTEIIYGPTLASEAAGPAPVPEQGQSGARTG